MRPSSLRLATLLWLTLSIAEPAAACFCATFPLPKNEFRSAQLVFIGRVETVGEVVESQYKHESGGVRFVTVRVERAFKGAETGQLITLRQPRGGCTHQLETGNMLLFYLQKPYQAPWVWQTFVCSRTNRLEFASEDLPFLYRLPESLKGTRLAGNVALYDPSKRSYAEQRKPLAGVRLRIAGNDRSEEVATNDAGIYELYGLPPGEYQVTIDLPAKTRIEPDFASKPALITKRVTLRPDGEADASFRLVVDNSIAGRVLNPAGAPIAGVHVELEPLVEGGRLGLATARTDTNGRFELRSAPPGAYRLVVNKIGPRGDAPFQPLYWPGTFDRQQAAVLTMAAGEHHTNFELRVPALVPLIRVAGRLETLDGVAVAGQRVEFRAATAENGTESATTGPDGAFELHIPAGRVGELSGNLIFARHLALKCPEWLATMDPVDLEKVIHTAVAAIGGNEDRTGLVLTLPVAWCREWQGPMK